MEPAFDDLRHQRRPRNARCWSDLSGRGQRPLNGAHHGARGPNPADSPRPGRTRLRPLSAPPPGTGTARTLADAVFVIDGTPSTCADLFAHPCDYTLQSQYNQWGPRLEQFLTTSPLGSYADRIGFAASAKLSLQACALSRTVGKTFLEFVAAARAEHPDATSPQLFPFWHRTRQGLCPGV